MCHLFQIDTNIVVCLDRCRHGAIAKYFEDEKPECKRACDFCKDSLQALRELETMQRGAVSNKNQNR